VTAYQLVNFDEFSPEGRFIGRKQPVQAVAPISQETVETV
jgi:hypothetical protein